MTSTHRLASFVAAALQPALLGGSILLPGTAGAEIGQPLSLAGEWRIQLDRDDRRRRAAL